MRWLIPALQALLSASVYKLLADVAVRSGENENDLMIV